MTLALIIWNLLLTAFLILLWWDKIETDRELYDRDSYMWRLINDLKRKIS